MLNNPRMLAAATAILCMFVDDLPEAGYNTFHDPGTAAFLSIILADACVSVARSSGTAAYGTVAFIILFIPGLILKLFLQPLFWVQDAWLYLIPLFLLSHGLLGFLAMRKSSFQLRMQMVRVTLGGVIAALFVALLVGIIGIWFSNWIVFYFQLAAARILVPFAFWTMVVRLEARLPAFPAQSLFPPSSI